MSLAQPFLAVDWGTTNRRIFLIEQEQVLRTHRDDKGVLSVKDFAAEVAAIRQSLGDLPMILAGMVGADIGWREAPYAPVPAGIDQLAAQVVRIDARTVIVPGVSFAEDGISDVMRGEEVQLLGAMQAGFVPANALLAQPGTHCKWAELEAGRITRFTTAMTGELFALLRRHSLLAPQLQGEVTVGEPFLAGVAEGSGRDLGASLFRVRAAKLHGLREDADAAPFTSGLLIGSDVAARLEQSAHQTVHVLADPPLGKLYTAAIEACGRSAKLVDSQAAFVAGIVALRERLA